MTTWALPDPAIIDSPAAVPRLDDGRAAAGAITATLTALGLPVTVPRWTVGPVVTRYEIEPEAGTRVSRIRLATPDVALALAASSIRVEAPIPGRHAVGIEIPHARPTLVTLREAIASVAPDAPPLTVPIGADVGGAIQCADLAAMPHLLIAGATGSGKSVMVNALLASLLLRADPDALRLVLVDMKRVELAAYHDLPHLLAPILTEPAAVRRALDWLVVEMERRYGLLARAGARNIGAYHDLAADRLPYVVVVVDELADLVMRGRSARAIDVPLIRLAQKARAVGIHLILATQRPSVNVVTGLVKANAPARIAFAMTSNIDSRTILDRAGAEDLIGRGDMLYQPSDAPRPMRLQGAYVSDREIAAIAAAWRAQGAPEPGILAEPVAGPPVAPEPPPSLAGRAFVGLLRALFDRGCKLDH